MLGGDSELSIERRCDLSFSIPYNNRKKVVNHDRRRRPYSTAGNNSIIFAIEHCCYLLPRGSDLAGELDRDSQLELCFHVATNWREPCFHVTVIWREMFPRGGNFGGRSIRSDSIQTITYLPYLLLFFIVGDLVGCWMDNGEDDGCAKLQYLPLHFQINRHSAFRGCRHHL